ncbi:MAG: HAMP domain-containing histidine kinase [Ignavibacteria bacterium]|nr:HAMP domain-containing histidine kinase [Ignavibacteria bacterium]
MKKHPMRERTKESFIAGEMTESRNFSEEINQLKRRIDILQKAISSLNDENRDIKRINTELEIEKQHLEETVKKLEEIHKKKDELFTMYIHDIKNPAATIKSMAELFSHLDLTLDEQKEIIKALTITADKLIRITTEITKILTYEFSFIEIEFSLHSIEKVLEDVYSCNKQKAKLKGQNISLDIKTTLPEVEIDKDMIFDAIDNLLDNAIKFSDDSKTIHLTAELEADHISVQVLDNGPGIPLQEIEKAFKKGSRLSPKPTGGEISTGYGLWIVKKIVEAHHGKVWLKSDQKKGSNFGFKIPVRQTFNNN